MARLNHTFEPVIDDACKVLVLGTFPSVKSRENHFYYGHPQNRFWKVLAALWDEPVPVTIEEKKGLLLRRHVAVWDVIAACEIAGSSDSSIRSVVPNDIPGLLEGSQVKAVFANGAKAAKLYGKHCLADTGMPIRQLPSTSPANAAWNLERLVRSWQILKEMTMS